LYSGIFWQKKSLPAGLVAAVAVFKWQSKQSNYFHLTKMHLEKAARITSFLHATNPAYIQSLIRVISVCTESLSTIR